MEQKDIQTTMNQTQQQQLALQNLIFFKEERQSEFILQHLLKNYNEQEIDSRNKLARVKNTLQDQLDNFSLAQRSHFRKYLVSDQLKKYLAYFCGQSMVDDDSVSHNQKIIALKETYIGLLATKIEQLLIRIKAWKQQKTKLLERKNKESRANLLIYKQYNIRNYLQQLLLIKDLITRVNKIFSQKIPDIRHLQELVGKRGVPYLFYKKYCLNNCCRAISIRTKQQNLTMLVQSASNLQLLQYMKIYFLEGKTLYQKCSLLLTFAKFIRITNQNSLSVQNGFVLAFKPYFIESLKESSNVKSMEYLKSRSIMQSNDETIDIWHEFQQITLQMYCLWYYEQMNSLKKHELLHIQSIKQSLQQYKSKYAWIHQIELKSNKIHGTRNFSEVFIKNVITIILKPILLHLYFYKIPSERIKKIEKYSNEYNQYWIYWLFRSFPSLYGFLNDKLKEMIGSFTKIQKFVSFEEGQLNPTQYYIYYEQISQIIRVYLQRETISRQFYQFWKNVIVKISSSILKQKNKIQLNDKFQDQIQSQSILQDEQKLLIQLIKNKKRLDPQYLLETLYIKVTKLNFNTSNYFLLQEAIKLLSKENQKQIQFIRQVAYKQFYK